VNNARLGAAGLGVLAVTTAIARSREVHPAERGVFHTVNDLPRALLPPTYALMQAGSFPAVFVVAEGFRRWGRPRRAALIATAGTGAWLGCKGVKSWVGRGRPSAHLEGVTTRGPAERGLGFPSGHSAIAFTMATIAAPELSPVLRALVWAWAATVASSRVYVGAHLPLDIVGGAALGLALGSAARLATDQLS
jgi:undecaprenyl-diphosphatase